MNKIISNLLLNNELEKAKKYFDRIEEEILPTKFDENINIQHYLKEKIFNFYYNKESWDIANNFSKKEREEKKLSETFTYGETTYRSLSYIFEYTKLEDNIIDGNFYDLGSGAGKALISASLIFPFKKCIGVELLDSLFLLSENVKEKYNENIEKQINENKEIFKDFNNIPIIENIKDDILNAKIINPSVILVCSTMFDENYMNILGEKLEKESNVGTIIITLTEKFNKFDINNWSLKKPFKVKFSWGFPSIYIYRKLK